MTSPFQLHRLPFAEDASAGEPLNAVARQLEAAARAPDINLLDSERLFLLNLAERCEARALLADADRILAGAVDVA